MRSAASLLLMLTVAVQARAAIPAIPPAAARPPAPATAARAVVSMPAQEQGAAEPNVDIITPHIRDSYEIEIPYWAPPFTKELCLGRETDGRCGPLWNPVRIGPLTLQLSPTKHVAMLLFSSTLCILVLVGIARSHTRATSMIGRPKGFANGIEAMVLYLRDEIILPTVGPHGERYVPYLLSLFFFILFANLLGLIPFGATPTGNISVTAMMAILSFVVIEISGMVSLGRGYLSTIFYWNPDLPIFLRVLLFLIMSPIELVSKLTKPFALAIRLFANMTAGHIVVLAFIGLIFTFRSLASGAPFLMAVGVMLLEIFVAFLQAFIFMLLTSVFIGQVREAHH